MSPALMSAEATDQSLLGAYAQRQDAQAFAEILRRYASLVYATSLRVTANAADAEDVTQDCFLQLARRAGEVAGSLPSFLHVLARNRALEFLRSADRRQNREAIHADLRAADGSSALDEWHRLSPLIDQAISELPDDLGDLVVRHYLQGQSQTQIASELSLNQGTISRRLDQAIALLRENLASAVPALTAPALLSQLSQNAMLHAPAHLTSELAKIAVAGVTRPPRQPANPLTRRRVLIMAAVITTIGLVGYVLQAVVDSPPPPRPPAVATAPSTSPASPSLAVLQGVPRIGFDLYPCPFPGCFVSTMQYLKQPANYDDVMAISGAAFRRVFNPNDPANVDLSDFYPEPFRRTFNAFGYDYRIISSSSEREMWSAIKQSISAGKPVFAFGIVGPPECGLVTGYDEATNALLGYSYFQKSPDIYYKQPNWHATAHFPGPLGMIVLGDKHPAPPQRDILISTLNYAIQLSEMTQPPWLPGAHSAGLLAYDAWAAALEVDADYPHADKATMDLRILVHWNETTMLSERASAARYLRKMAQAFPEASEELNAAAELYDQVAAEVKNIYPPDLSRGPAILAALSDPKTRRAYAVHIRAARNNESQAIEILKSALVKLH